MIIAIAGSSKTKVYI